MTDHPEIRVSVKDVFSMKKSIDENAIVIVEKVEPSDDYEVGCAIAICIAPGYYENNYILTDDKLKPVFIVDKDKHIYTLDDRCITTPENIIDLIKEATNQFLASGKDKFLIVNGELKDDPGL